MQPIQRLDQFLPARFSDGTVVRQFSKPCVKCGQMLHARHMHGIARLLGDHLAVAADADCPVCKARFGVACVIDTEKRVRRVALPFFLFKLYLRLLALSPAEIAARQVALDEALASAEASPASPPPAPDYPRSEAIIGRYADKPIAAHIVVNGQQLPFDRIQADGQLAPGEYLLDGCFVYKPAQS